MQRHGIVRSTVFMMVLLSIPLWASPGEGQRLSTALPGDIVSNANPDLLILHVDNKVRMTVGSAEDLTGIASGSISLGTLNGQYAPVGNLPPIQTRIVRTIQSLWRATVSNEIPVNELQVEYSVMSDNGIPGILIHSDRPESRIAVDISPLPLEVHPKNKNMNEIIGGVDVIFDIENVHAAGVHRGYVTVTVQRL